MSFPTRHWPLPYNRLRCCGTPPGWEPRHKGPPCRWWHPPVWRCWRVPRKGSIHLAQFVGPDVEIGILPVVHAVQGKAPGRHCLGLDGFVRPQGQHFLGHHPVEILFQGQGIHHIQVLFPAVQEHCQAPRYFSGSPAGDFWHPPPQETPDCRTAFSGPHTGSRSSH